MLHVTTTLPIPAPDGEPVSPRVGDHVRVTGEVLAEVGREAAGLPPMWVAVPAGTNGKVLGWRDRAGEPRAIVELFGMQRRLVVFLSEPRITRVPQPPVVPRIRRGRPRQA